MIPNFARVRVVKVVEFQGKLYLVCSCGYFERHGLGCRHVYKVLGRPPKPEDAIVRWRIDYLRYYNKKGCERLTEMFNKCRRDEPPGVPFCQPCEVAVGAGDASQQLLVERASHLLGDEEPSDAQPLQIRPGNHWCRPTNERVGAISRPTEPPLAHVQSLLQEEGGLSQYAASQKATDDDGGNHVADREAPDDYVPGPWDNGDEEVSTTSPSEVNSEEEPGCIASIDIREPNPQRLEAMRNANRQGGFYNNWMSLYQQMTNLASTNPGRFGHVCFEAMQGAVAHMQADTMPINAAMSSTISFPAVDRQKTCRRMKQASSPAKKSKHK
jgi:hypothetical protein